MLEELGLEYVVKPIDLISNEVKVSPRREPPAGPRLRLRAVPRIVAVAPALGQDPRRGRRWLHALRGPRHLPLSRTQVSDQPGGAEPAH